MTGFLGGSAWAMARDIGRGHILPTDRMLARLSGAERRQLAFEIERELRSVRGEQPDLNATLELQRRNHVISRLQRAQFILRSVQSGRGRG